MTGHVHLNNTERYAQNVLSQSKFIRKLFKLRIRITRLGIKTQWSQLVPWVRCRVVASLPHQGSETKIFSHHDAACELNKFDVAW